MESLRYLGSGLALSAALVAVALSASPALAAGSVLTPSAQTVQVGETIGLSVTGFKPCPATESLALFWDQNQLSYTLVASLTPNDFTVDFVVPSSPVGSHVIAAGCATVNGYELQQRVTVQVVAAALALASSPGSIQPGGTVTITGSGFVSVHGPRRGHDRRAIGERDITGDGQRIEWRFPAGDHGSVRYSGRSVSRDRPVLGSAGQRSHLDQRVRGNPGAVAGFGNPRYDDQRHRCRLYPVPRGGAAAAARHDTDRGDEQSVRARQRQLHRQGGRAVQRRPRDRLPGGRRVLPGRRYLRSDRRRTVRGHVPGQLTIADSELDIRTAHRRRRRAQLGNSSTSPSPANSERRRPQACPAQRHRRGTPAAHGYRWRWPAAPVLASRWQRCSWSGRCQWFTGGMAGAGSASICGWWARRPGRCRQALRTGLERCRYRWGWNRTSTI